MKARPRTQSRKTEEAVDHRQENNQLYFQHTFMYIIIAWTDIDSHSRWKLILLSVQVVSVFCCLFKSTCSALFFIYVSLV